MKAVPFKTEISDKAWYFNLYYFHCIECGAEYSSHKCDSRTKLYCGACYRKHEREREALRKNKKEKEKEQQIKNKAIDDFAERIIEMYSYLPAFTVKELAERLKKQADY